MSKAILLIGGVTHIKKEWSECASVATLLEFEGTTRDDFFNHCRSGKYDQVVAIYRSNESTALTGPFNKELVQILPKCVKYICHNGAGYDNIEVGACSERGILVSSTPIAVNGATADIAIFLLLGALRRIHIPYSAVRTNAWRGPTFTLGHDPRNLTLGIIGMGGIGTEVAIRAVAFGMKIQYHNRTRLSPEKEALAGNAKYVGFEELLKTSDVISLNLSLNNNTEGIIGRKEFAAMKDGVVLVNTARGKLIDEEALVEALEGGKVWSAGLDVYQDEPTIHPGLLKSDNVVLLPHIGTATKETQKAMELLVLENIKSALQTGTLITLVPEQSKL